MEEIDYKKFASQLMIDVAKLLITLASGFFVLSATLINILSDGKNDPIQAFWSLAICWICLIFSIIFGTLALGGIATAAHDKAKFDVDDSVTSIMLKLQQTLFVISFVFVAWFAFANK